MAFLSESARQTLLVDLDTGANLFGPLSFEARARICAAANDPSQESWNAAYSVIIRNSPATTLWQALLAHTDYDVQSFPVGEDWPQVPTQSQILEALHAAISEGD